MTPDYQQKELMTTRASLRVQYPSYLAKTSKPDQAAAPLPAWPTLPKQRQADLITAKSLKNPNSHEAEA
jgi:hypothetical protein